MNIAIIQPRLSYYAGGGEKYPLEVIPFLARSNPNLIFTIYTTKQATNESDMYKLFKREVEGQENILIKELEVPSRYQYLYDIPPGEKRFRWDIESYFFANLVLNEIINNENPPDIVWAYYLLDFPFKLDNVKTVLNLLGYPRIKSEYREAILLQYDRIVSINDNIINKWNELLDMKINNYECLALGINKMPERLSTEIEKDSSYFNVVFAGRLIKRKGVLDLCEVINNLVKQNRRVRLYILGEGILSEDIKRYIAEFKLEDNIVLLGFKRNVSDYYSSADLVILPSYPGEGQMSAVIEAMHFNGNVVTTKDNGNEDYIENAVSGYLVNPGDIGQMAQIICNQIEGNVDLKKIKELAKKRVEENNWPEYGKRFVEICEGLLYEPS